MKQNLNNHLFCQDQNESPWEKFKNGNFTSQERKKESRIIAVVFKKVQERIVMLCSRLRMPQGKRRFDEVKTKFEEWKFWKLKIVKKDKNKV